MVIVFKICDKIDFVVILYRHGDKIFSCMFILAKSTIHGVWSSAYNLKKKYMVDEFVPLCTNISLSQAHSRRSKNGGKSLKFFLIQIYGYISNWL